MYIIKNKYYTIYEIAKAGLLARQTYKDVIEPYSYHGVRYIVLTDLGDKNELMTLERDGNYYILGDNLRAFIRNHKEKFIKI